VVPAIAFCVNLRFVVFSAPMGPYVMHLPRWQRIVSGYFIADLTYVLLVKRFPYPANDTPDRSQQMAYLAGSAIIKWVSWISCSALGVVLANSMPPQWGLGALWLAAACAGFWPALPE
jgi:predicted branched-subunit amino acid permease